MTVPDEGGIYHVRDPNFYIVPGLVRTTINTVRLTGTNQTVDGWHIFEGDVYIGIELNADGLADYTAEGFGTSGWLVDFINQNVGPSVFVRMGADSAFSARVRGVCR